MRIHGVSEETFDTGRKYGTGSVILQTNGKAKIWYLKGYVQEGRRRVRRKIRLGTLEEIPTLKEAAAAADYITAVGPSTVIELIRQRHRARYGGAQFTAEWFMEKLKEQNYQCAICLRVPKRLVVDHDHEDGELRGLLCTTCNSGIGLLRDDSAVVRAALAYLEAYGK